MEMTFENDGKIENEKRTEMQKERMQSYQEKINALKVKSKRGGKLICIQNLQNTSKITFGNICQNLMPMQKFRSSRQSKE